MSFDIPFRAQGIGKFDSKSKVKNCLSARLVTPPRIELGSTV
jgi:hypothetical protein